MLGPLFIFIEPNGSITFYSENDNRTSFNCNDYIIDTINSTYQMDTFYIQKNINNKTYILNSIKNKMIILN